ncbi:hypothetical protein HYT25_03125 [Candidatus Pacearchaeota archaeon]|nr:hypothetical protein [Candidatus Pacearchaeota archaeon]
MELTDVAIDFMDGNLNFARLALSAFVPSRDFRNHAEYEFNSHRKTVPYLTGVINSIVVGSTSIIGGTMGLYYIINLIDKF